MEIDPEWNVKKHRHSFFEFHYVSGGYTYTTINNVERRINAGSFYIMPPGTYHSHRQDQGKGHSGFALRWEFVKKDVKVEFGGSSYELESIGELLLNVSAIPVEDGGKILNQMTDLLERTEQEVWNLTLQLAFCQLLFNIAGFYNDDKSSFELNVNQSLFENQTVRGAMNFIRENYSQDIDVEAVAHSIHSSYSHLSRLFKKHTGETLSYHLNKVRLVNSQKLLKCSDKSIAQIAREVGIGNDQYFCTLFKKVYGISPGNYRNNRKYFLE